MARGTFLITLAAVCTTALIWTWIGDSKIVGSEVPKGDASAAMTDRAERGSANNLSVPLGKDIPDAESGPSLPAIARAGNRAVDTREAELRRLIQSGDPKDAMAAYRLITECSTNTADRITLASMGSSSQSEQFRERLRWFDEAIIKSCAGISALDIRSRLDYLGIALNGKVVGAAAAYASEGPNGDIYSLETRPDDLGVQKWKSDTISILLSTALAGEIENFGILSNIYQNGSFGEKNLQIALRYQAAQIEATRRAGGNVRGLERVAEFLSVGLSKDAREQAVRDGRALIENCCLK